MSATLGPFPLISDSRLRMG